MIDTINIYRYTIFYIQIIWLMSRFNYIYSIMCHPSLDQTHYDGMSYAYTPNLEQAQNFQIIY